MATARKLTPRKWNTQVRHTGKGIHEYPKYFESKNDYIDSMHRIRDGQRIRYQSKIIILNQLVQERERRCIR